MNRRWLIALIFITVMGIGLLGVKYFFSSENVWVCQNGEWVKNGNPPTSIPATQCGERSQEGVSNEKVETNNSVINQKESNCSDTDGIDYYTKGQVIVCNFVTKEEPGGSPVGCSQHDDFCLTEFDDPTGKELYEYYCEENDLKFEKYVCDSRCSSGTCVR